MNKCEWNIDGTIVTREHRRTRRNSYPSPCASTKKMQ